MRRALARAMSHLNTLDALEAEQKQQALIYLLLLILHRRPADEHEELITVVDRHADEMKVEMMAQSMAEVLFEEGKVQGIEQERRESAIRHILVVLKTKFAADIVSVLTPAIENISDVERLEQLLPAAVEAQSLEAFARILHEDGS